MDHRNAWPKAMDVIFDQLERSEISSIKNVVSGIMGLISDPSSTAKDLKEIIEIDPPLTARVLFLANSAYYSPRVKILDIMQAIIFVGFDAIKELALSQKILNLFQDDTSVGGYSALALWKHSVATGLFVKMIYRREFRNQGEAGYACGLLHDIGIIALQQFLPDQFNRILETMQNGEKSMYRAEQKALGFDHAELGQAITQYLEFPEEIFQAIGAQAQPARATSRMAQALFIANTTTRSNDMGYGVPFVLDKKGYNNCLRQLDISVQAIDLIMADVKQEIADMEAKGLLNYEK